jgi:hypothetical protein
MFGFTKFVKLMGLLLRNPSDVLFVPVSIVFGYFHGLIKLYALITLNMVSFFFFFFFFFLLSILALNHPMVLTGLLFRRRGAAELTAM